MDEATLEKMKAAFVESLETDPHEPWHQGMANDLWRTPGAGFTIDGKVDLARTLRAALTAAEKAGWVMVPKGGDTGDVGCPGL